MATARCRAVLLRPVLLLLALAACSTAFLAPAPLYRLPASTTTPARRQSSLVVHAASTPTPTPAAASGPVPAPGPKLVFKGLRSQSFRHPLDQQATEQLRRLPGLEWIVRRLMRVAEEAVYLVSFLVWFRRFHIHWNFALNFYHPIHT